MKPAVRATAIRGDSRARDLVQGSSAPHAQAECTGTETSSLWPQRLRFAVTFTAEHKDLQANAGITASRGAACSSFPDSSGVRSGAIAQPAAEATSAYSA